MYKCGSYQTRVHKIQNIREIKIRVESCLAPQRVGSKF